MTLPAPLQLKRQSKPIENKSFLFSSLHYGLIYLNGLKKVCYVKGTYIWLSSKSNRTVTSSLLQISRLCHGNKILNTDLALHWKICLFCRKNEKRSTGHINLVAFFFSLLFKHTKYVFIQTLTPEEQTWWKKEFLNYH